MFGKISYVAIAMLFLLFVAVPEKVYAIKGCDISSLTVQEGYGVVYNECDEEKDMLEILGNHGIELIRIRLFVNPDTSTSGTEQNLAYVTTLAARCQAAGMKVMLALHYSDTWADPDTQTKPTAWSSLTQSQLVTQVYNYTYSVCSTIQPDYVQIGNEITCGMLWPNGEVCSYGNWSNLRALITSAHNAVKAANNSAITVVHVAETSSSGCKWFFDNLTSSSVSFDMIGLSYYPEYHGSISNLSAINSQAASYGKSVMLCEIGDYYYGTGYSETTQATFVTNVLAVNSNAIYWEPGWVWSSSVGYRALFKPINNNWKNMEMTAGLVAFGGSACGENSAPTVSITSPSSGATYTAPASVTINASASDSDGTISSVKFYQGSTLLNTDTSSPYSYTWSSVSAGTYSLTAVATDNDSATTTSSAVSITVNNDTTAPAAPSGLTATAGNASVTLNWNDNSESDLTGYNVYRSTTSGSGYSKLNSSLLSSSDYTDVAVTNGITYYYVVTAVDTYSNESSYSSQASAMPEYQNCLDVQNGGDRLLADINGDCFVNFGDLEIISVYWLNFDCENYNDCEDADIEPIDGVVDIFDFGDFAAEWMQCNDPQTEECTANW